MKIKVDHAVICESELAPMEHAFAGLGLNFAFGGAHNNPTEMAQLGFEDGTYLAILAAVKPPAPPSYQWSRFINADAGPCTWAILSTDIEQDTQRIAKSGTTVQKPEYTNRKKPDGTLVEFKRATVGLGQQQSTLPFLIQDITPHAERLRVSASTKEKKLTGLSVVVVGVKDLDKNIELFQRVYNLPAPKVEDHPEFGARVAYFDGSPVMLATPLKEDSWLSKRLAELGQCPAALLLGTSDFDASAAGFSLKNATHWFNHSVVWFDPQKLRGVRMGIIGN